VTLLSILAIVVNYKIKKEKVDKAPSNFINIVEILVEFVNGIVKSNMGDRGMTLAPFITTLISYLALGNILGIVGLTPPTTDLSITLTLALSVFFMVQFTKIRSNGGLIGYLKSFTKPMAMITPINIISDIAN